MKPVPKPITKPAMKPNPVAMKIQQANKPCIQCVPNNKLIPIYMCCAQVGPNGKPLNPNIEKIFPHVAGMYKMHFEYFFF